MYCSVHAGGDGVQLSEKREHRLAREFCGNFRCCLIFVHRRLQAEGPAESFPDAAPLFPPEAVLLDVRNLLHTNRGDWWLLFGGDGGWRMADGSQKNLK